MSDISRNSFVFFHIFCLSIHPSPSLSICLFAGHPIKSTQWEIYCFSNREKRDGKDSLSNTTFFLWIFISHSSWQLFYWKIHINKIFKSKFFYFLWSVCLSSVSSSQELNLLLVWPVLVMGSDSIFKLKYKYCLDNFIHVSYFYAWEKRLGWDVCNANIGYWQLKQLLRLNDHYPEPMKWRMATTMLFLCWPSFWKTFFWSPSMIYISIITVTLIYTFLHFHDQHLSLLTCGTLQVVFYDSRGIISGC